MKPCLTSQYKTDYTPFISLVLFVSRLNYKKNKTQERVCLIIYYLPNLECKSAAEHEYVLTHCCISEP